MIRYKYTTIFPKKYLFFGKKKFFFRRTATNCFRNNLQTAKSGAAGKVIEQNTQNAETNERG